MLWKYFLNPNGEHFMNSFSREVKVFGQHWHNGGDLLFSIKSRQIGRRFKVERHLVVDSRHDLHQLQLSTELSQIFTQWLYEPGAITGVSPGVKAYQVEWWVREEIQVRTNQIKVEEKSNQSKLPGAVEYAYIKSASTGIFSGVSSIAESVSMPLSNSEPLHAWDAKNDEVKERRRWKTIHSIPPPHTHNHAQKA